MKSHIYKLISALIFFLLVCSGCSVAKGEGFAIYLTKADIPPSAMGALSHVEIAERPIISIDDIVSYDARTHEIRLDASAFGRISRLEVPVNGKSFLVCIDKEPLYWGAFWTPFSSLSFDGVTILKPLDPQGSPTITLELGYPSSSVFSDEDPRNRPEILRSLGQAGKLTNRPGISDAETLPHSLKGYELYSWEEESGWYFTLITGTNRTKTMEEITSGDDFFSESGFVKITVAGADAIKNVLSRLPEGESVFWCDELHTWPPESADLRLPPERIVEAIGKYAEELALDFSITFLDQSD